MVSNRVVAKVAMQLLFIGQTVQGLIPAGQEPYSPPPNYSNPVVALNCPSVWFFAPCLYSAETTVGSTTVFYGAMIMPSSNGSSGSLTLSHAHVFDKGEIVDATGYASGRLVYTKTWTSSLQNDFHVVVEMAFPDRPSEPMGNASMYLYNMMININITSIYGHHTFTYNHHWYNNDWKTGFLLERLEKYDKGNASEAVDYFFAINYRIADLSSLGRKKVYHAFVRIQADNKKNGDFFARTEG